MQTKLKGFWEKIKGFFAKLNKKTRILLGICAGVILILIIAAAILLNRKEYAVLKTGLNATDTSTIVRFLDDNGVTDYQVQGDSILVPKGREVQLQAQLALSGYSTTGFLYESYKDGIGGISTKNEQDRLWLISVQDRLAAVIRQYEGVRDAWVQITPGTERVYVLDPKATPATASVTVELENNTQPLSSGVVTAIRGLVSHSVSGLEFSNVEIGDTIGNPYSDGSTMDSMSEAGSMKLYYEEQVSRQVRTQVLQALDAIYGPDNVRVAVYTTVDVNRKVVDKVQYNQSEGSVEGGGLTSKNKWYWEIIRDGTEPVGGTVGTATNSDIPYYPDWENELTGNENYAGAGGEQNHAIDTTKEQMEVLAFSVSDIQVAVTINQNCSNAGSLSMDSLYSHVATASGVRSVSSMRDEAPENYVSVVIAPFDSPESPAVVPGLILDPWVLYAAIGGLALFLLLLLIILLLLRRRKKKKLAKQKALEEEMMAAEALAAAEAAAVLPATGGADIMEINTEKSMELRQSVRQFAQNNPEIAAQIVKAWLKGDDNNG